MNHLYRAIIAAALLVTAAAPASAETLMHKGDFIEARYTGHQQEGIKVYTASDCPWCVGSTVAIFFVREDESEPIGYDLIRAADKLLGFTYVHAPEGNGRKLVFRVRPILRQAPGTDPKIVQFSRSLKRNDRILWPEWDWSRERAGDYRPAYAVAAGSGEFIPTDSPYANAELVELGWVKSGFAAGDGEKAQLAASEEELTALLDSAQIARDTLPEVDFGTEVVVAIFADQSRDPRPIEVTEQVIEAEDIVQLEYSRVERVGDEPPIPGRSRPYALAVLKKTPGKTIRVVEADRTIPGTPYPRYRLLASL